MPPRRVLVGTYVAFGIAVAAGALPGGGGRLGAAAWSARASILAGVLYTGGPRPYGYEGLGELFVFLFFGVVAVAGSYFVQTRGAALGGVRARGAGGPAGRGDPGGEQRARHRHRPARGQAHAGGEAGPRAGARRLFAAMVARRFLVPPPLVAGALALGAARAGGAAAGACRWSAPWHAAPTAPALNQALAGTGRLLAVFSLLLAVGVLLS